MDERLNALSAWITNLLGFQPKIKPASEDASFRRYFRIFCQNRQAYVVMDAPPEHESVKKFVEVAARYESLGVNVPQIFAINQPEGFALLSDLGAKTYLQALSPDSVDQLYAQALTTLFTLQTQSINRLEEFELYDQQKIREEMELFRQWFIPYRTERELKDKNQRLIDNTFELLTDTALRQPRTWVHRDFHSRNLMITPQNSPGVLDFQDAVTGPITYDLVSLLRDCYVEWPEEQVYQWVSLYYQKLQNSSISLKVNETEFIRWFDWMGVQRHIKVLGIFSRLYHRDGKDHYLKNLPLVFRYTTTICNKYEALRPFAAFLNSLRIKWKH